MKIPLILNNEKTVIEASPEEKLSKVLRELNLSETKTGCQHGSCGACTVLLNDKPVPSCLIPAALVKDQKIVTLESFKTTEMYANIMKGFTKAGIKLCGHCNAGKIFAAKMVLESSEKPTKSNVFEKVKHLSLCCTDIDTLIEGIIYAYSINLKR